MKEIKIMNYCKPSVTVIYLAGGIDWGINAPIQFFDSYNKFCAGYEHNLIV